jgi:ribonuclease E
MANKMLIDASHPEETRVVVVRGNRIEEFDFESEHKKQIRGNIYLARVTRVEPSLQAAFVEYGGNRHGFLAFSEIHPDYYQIPFADRQALLEAEAAEHAEDEEDDEHDVAADATRQDPRNRRREKRDEEAATPEASEPTGELEAHEGHDVPDSLEEASTETSDDDEIGSKKPTIMEMAVEEDSISEESTDIQTVSEKPRRNDRSRRSRKPDRNDDEPSDDGHIEEQEVIESVGAEDAMEEVPMRKRTSRRQYKIQEVIKRRQVLLVQVVKEERGNKGAALTTYLSLAGRYSVLMPNTGRGGGISRKITSIQDRKRLKDVVKDLEVPQGMGVILRTAGANRTKVEIKRDYEYLMRAWETVRNLTLASQAPALVYEEGSLIKRSIRDLYNKDIGEIIVAGENGYREAKDFMRMLMPSHAKMVQPYREITPIFAKAGIEAQLDRMLQPQVTLKSGGYIIINQTEALVSVDVNSGRSTREHSIEDTALQTNLEAAEEVARQLRLRDLAGLVVIDFIDMEEKRNNRSVEKRLKDHLKNDRARIQVGRISHFGLLEMSRQRIRASVLESTMQVCAHCGGTGHVRSQSSLGLHVIRSIEEYLQRSSTNDIIVKTSIATALYVLNHKRDNLSELEARFGLNISMEADDKVGTLLLLIEKGPIATGTPRGPLVAEYVPTPEDEADEAIVDMAEEEAEVEDIETQTADETAVAPRAPNAVQGENDQRRKRRRRRRGRNRDDLPRDDKSATTDGEEEVGDLGASESANDEAAESLNSNETGETEQERKKRRRGRRGGRRNRDEDAPTAIVEEAMVSARETVAETTFTPVEEVIETPAEEVVKVAKPRGRKPKAKAEVVEELSVAPVETVKPLAKADIIEENEPIKVKKPRAPRKSASASVTKESALLVETPDAPTASVTQETVIPIVAPETTSDTEPTDDKPRKGGWWQRKGFF